jgi:hypothetical protein
LEQGTIIVLDGHVLEATEDADDPDRMRLVITPALGPPPGRYPDHREIVITAPGAEAVRWIGASVDRVAIKGSTPGPFEQAVPSLILPDVDGAVPDVSSPLLR